MFTAQLAAELKPLGIVVNSADPGFHCDGSQRTSGVPGSRAGAVAPVKLALIDDNGLTGACFGVTENCRGEPQQAAMTRRSGGNGMEAPFLAPS